MLEIRNISHLITLGLLDLKAFSTHAGLAVKREQEKAGTLYLLKALLNDEAVELTYSSTNKPFLKDRTEHISISHSHDKLAIICNKNHTTGIDIELIRDKVKHVQNKFLTDDELAFAQDDTEKLITLWAAKETLYKVYGLKELEFKLNLFVDPFLGNRITGHIKALHLNKSYLMAHERIDDYKLVYVLNEI